MKPDAERAAFRNGQRAKLDDDDHERLLKATKRHDQKQHHKKSLEDPAPGAPKAWQAKQAGPNADPETRKQKKPRRKNKKQDNKAPQSGNDQTAKKENAVASNPAPLIQPLSNIIATELEESSEQPRSFPPPKITMLTERTDADSKIKALETEIQSLKDIIHEVICYGGTLEPKSHGNLGRAMQALKKKMEKDL